MLPEATVYEFVVMTLQEKISIDKASRVDAFVKLEGGRGLRIGKFVHIASFAHLNTGGGSLEVQDGVVFASGAKVITGGNMPEGQSMSVVAPPEMQKLYSKHVVIGRNAALLTNSVLIGSNMGEGSVLAAGAVCLRDVPPFEIWGGVPARKIGVRK
jgi:acetyltransferase-like isoleucine patch superfamily enzyme